MNECRATDKRDLPYFLFSSREKDYVDITLMYITCMCVWLLKCLQCVGI